jgi:hypothetical protein
VTEFEYLNAGNTEAQDKLATAYLLRQVSQGKAKTGVLSGLAVSQTTTASTDVLVDAGAAVVQSAVLDGASVLVNDTQKTLPILTGANVMGAVPRNDIVVFDALTAAVTFIKGTPNAVPTDPTVPTNSIALARLRHAASATTVPAAKIDDLRVYTGLGVGTVPACQIRATVIQSPGIVNLVGTNIQFDSTVFDTDGMADLGNDQLVIQTAGRYRVRGVTCFAQGATPGVGYRRSALSVNGVVVRGDALDANATSGLPTLVTVDDERFFAVGDTIKVQAFHSYSAALNTQADAALYYSSLSATLISQ